MKVQLKNLRASEVKNIFNTVSKLISRLSDESKLDFLRVEYSIPEFIKENEKLSNNPAQYRICVSSKNNHDIILYLYDDTTGKPEDCEIMTKEDNVIFEDQPAVDFIFVPRQLLSNNASVESVYTALFVIFHLSFRLLANNDNPNIIDDENYSLLASLLAALLVSDSIFYTEPNIFGNYRDITKQTVDKLLNCNMVITDSSYLYLRDTVSLFKYGDFEEFYNILSEYFHNIHSINGEKDYE